MFFSIQGRRRGDAFGSGPRPAVSPLPDLGSLNISISPSAPETFIEHHLELKPRQDNAPSTDVSTCGYLDGNVTASRTANSGYDCRADTQNAIWGFCPTTVVSPGDCGLAGGCVDLHACSSGCGIIDVSGVTVFTCSASSAGHCSTALLIDGPDQTYSYLACASTAKTDTYFNTPTTASSQSTTSSSSAVSGATPSISSAAATSPATSSSPASTASSAIFSVSASPSSSPTTVPGPSNDIGAIVGGVIGGLALLSFLVMGFLFYRRLQTRHVEAAQDQQPTWEKTDLPEEALTKPPKEDSIPVELPSEDPTAELSGGRRGETTELPSNVRGSRHAGHG